MKHALPGLRSLALSAPLLLLLPVACGPGKPSEDVIDSSRLDLLGVSYGRLVDVYAYQRVDLTRTSDRRDELNRQPVLVAQNVVINPAVSNDELYDPQGNASPTANYRFLSFDLTTGHDELMILWDNRGAEATRFDTALKAATLGLSEIPTAVRGQNTLQRPIPIVPRDAAVVLRFSAPLPVDSTYFENNPSAVQLLEFNGDPHVIAPQDAFRSIPHRVIVSGNTIILDPTILGGESQGGFLSPGMPESPDNRTANVRIALPSRAGSARLFFVNKDLVAAQNDIDSSGLPSVVRDFRSGNSVDQAGGAGLLRDLEAPAIVGRSQMGIVSVSPTGILTVNKRQDPLDPIFIRGRYPFVGGAIDSRAATEGLVLGPSTVATTRALRSGDYIEQLATVQLPDGTPEVVRIRAEVLENLDVKTRVNPDVPNAFEGLGLDTGGSQGSDVIAHLRMGPIRGTDSLGRPVAFQPSDPNLDPTLQGKDCVLKRFYYENVPFKNGGPVISDAGHRHAFLKIDPEPTSVVPGDTGFAFIAPNTAVTIEFTEPMDVQRIDTTKNIVMTSKTITSDSFVTDMGTPKAVCAGVVPVRWSDQAGDGSLIQVTPPRGLFHLAGGTDDSYWFHLALGDAGITDLGGNSVDVYNQRIGSQLFNWSAKFTVDPSMPESLIGWHTYAFEDADEDGSPFGSTDMFGQFQLLGGRLFAAPTVRFTRDANDQTTLASINRANRGECLGTGTFVPANFGVLYWDPRVSDTVAPPNVPNPYPDFNIVSQPVGQVVEPHQPRGARVMMRYLEDDFGLNSRLAADMMVDVEQLYWSPFNDFDVLFDVFDRYSMALAHSDKRPDAHWTLVTPPPPANPFCRWDCSSMNSGLSTTFADNILRGSAATTVFEGKTYQIDPDNQVTSNELIKYIPYPKFDKTYTWRDSRLVTLDAEGRVIGTGGARNPGTDPIAPDVTWDWTADVDSPWIPSSTIPPSGVWTQDNGDFRGQRTRDLDPIALPLLVDFKMFYEDPTNSLARGSNGFQMAMIGVPPDFLGLAGPPSPGAYYNRLSCGACLRPDGNLGCVQPDRWPAVRVFSVGYNDPASELPVSVDPDNTPIARGGWVKDSGAVIMSGGTTVATTKAMVQVGPNDSMMAWARADFVRKVSSITFGFFDTRRPNQRVGSSLPAGYPDFVGDGSLGGVLIREFTSLLDPPLAQQPAGTKVVLEIRGAEDFSNANVIYDPASMLPQSQSPTAPLEGITNRGNLLNPNYACEAYRYSLPNSGASFTEPRLAVTQGLTQYVTEDRLSTIASPQTGLLPRYMNFRLVMTNNVDVTPALSPSLRSMSIIYRMERPQ